MPTYFTPFGGVAEIGGNKLLVETGAAPFVPLAHQPLTASGAGADGLPTRVWLDFGTSLGQEKTFFSGFLRPRTFTGLQDAFQLEFLPRLPGVYREDLLFDTGLPYTAPLVQGVLLSHIHADHVGNLPVLDPAIPVYGSPLTLGLLPFLQATQVVGDSDYLSGNRHVPRRNQSKLRRDARV